MIQRRLQRKQATEHLIDRLAFQIGLQGVVEPGAVALPNVRQESRVQAGGVGRRREALRIARDLIEPIGELLLGEFVTQRHGRVTKDAVHDVEHAWNSANVGGVARRDELGEHLLGLIQRRFFDVFDRVQMIEIGAVRCRTVYERERTRTYFPLRRAAAAMPYFEQR